MINAIYNYPIPTLKLGEDYLLRPQQIEDVEAFLDYYGDEAVGQYILAKTPKTLADAKAEVEYCMQLFQRRQGIYWAIARKSDNRMIGAVGFYMNNHHHRAELSYDLHKAYWRQGITSQAILILMNHLFRYAGIQRIEALTTQDNLASVKLLEKLGFVREGTLRNYRYFNNRSHDVEMFGITQTMLKNTVSLSDKKTVAA